MWVLWCDPQFSSPRVSAVETLLETVARDTESTRETDWAERDLAIILTGLLPGLRADELKTQLAEHDWARKPNHDPTYSAQCARVGRQR
jgi:hypothetical protein